MGNPVYKNVLILKYISAQNQTYNDFEIDTETEFKKFEPRLKYRWFHLKLYLMFQDLRRRSNKTIFLQI